MNKLTIPAILVATVMVAGIFAFMPVEQASTVHTSGTITIANDAITAAKIATGAIGADELATDAITSAELEATAITEIQSLQIVLTDDNSMNTAAVSCTATGASFLVHYNVSGFLDAQTLTIAGTATATALVYTAEVAAANHGIVGISGTVGGNSGETVTFATSADGAVGHFVLVTATGATGAACV